MAQAVLNAPPNSTPSLEPDPPALTVEKLKLTPEQKKLWGSTMSLMVWNCPGFQHLLYKLLSDKDPTNPYSAVPTRDVPVAATDARHVLINPDTFFKYPLKERVFILGHEIVHNVFGDVEFLNRCLRAGTVPMNDGTTLPFREQTMQKAMDYRINPLLRDSKIGAPPPDCLMDDTIAKAHDGVCDVYKRVYEDEESGGNKTGKHQPFDIVLQPGSTNNTGSMPRNQQQWGVEIAAAQTIEAMKNQGRGMSNALKRMFDDLLNPVVPWTDHIRGIFNRKVGSGSYNWRRPDRRFIVRDLYMPSRSGNGAGWVVVWGDTSGSISPKELVQYLTELAAIVEDCRPQRLTVCWCDDTIDRIDEISDAADLRQIQHAGVGGGGGTSCLPVFDWIANHTDKPEVFIGFTDGYVGFPPMEPDYLCIWASSTDKEYPWGDVVRLNP